MAEGKKCPQHNCGYWMIAVNEKEDTYGTWVTYRCRACGFEERIFEPKKNY